MASLLNFLHHVDIGSCNNIFLHLLQPEPSAVRPVQDALLKLLLVSRTCAHSTVVLQIWRLLVWKCSEKKNKHELLWCCKRLFTLKNLHLDLMHAYTCALNAYYECISPFLAFGSDLLHMTGLRATYTQEVYDSEILTLVYRNLSEINNQQRQGICVLTPMLLSILHRFVSFRSGRMIFLDERESEQALHNLLANSLISLTTYEGLQIMRMGTLEALYYTVDTDTMQVILNSTLQIFIDAVESRSVDRDVCFMHATLMRMLQGKHEFHRRRIKIFLMDNNIVDVFSEFLYNNRTCSENSFLASLTLLSLICKICCFFEGMLFDRLMQTMLTCFDRMATVPAGFGICVWTLTHILNHRRRLISENMMLTLVTTFTKPGAHRKLFHDAALDVLGVLTKKHKISLSAAAVHTIGYFVIGKFVQSAMRIDDWRQSVGIMRCCISQFDGALVGMLTRNLSSLTALMLDEQAEGHDVQNLLYIIKNILTRVNFENRQVLHDSICSSVLPAMQAHTESDVFSDAKSNILLDTSHLRLLDAMIAHSIVSAGIVEHIFVRYSIKLLGKYRKNKRMVGDVLTLLNRQVRTRALHMNVYEVAHADGCLHKLVTEVLSVQDRVSTHDDTSLSLILNLMLQNPGKFLSATSTEACADNEAMFLLATCFCFKMLRDEYNRTAGPSHSRVCRIVHLLMLVLAEDSRKYGLQGNTKARISQAVLIMTHFRRKIEDSMVSAECMFRKTICTRIRRVTQQCNSYLNA